MTWSGSSTRSNSHSVAARSSCTNIPLASGEGSGGRDPRMRTVVSSLFYEVLVVIVLSSACWHPWVPRWSSALQGVPSPTSYPAGRGPRHDPLFGSEELRGERRHSSSAALSGSPRLITATAPSAPPDQSRPAVLARSVDPHSPV